MTYRKSSKALWGLTLYLSKQQMSTYVGGDVIDHVTYRKSSLPHCVLTLYQSKQHISTHVAMGEGGYEL